MNVLLDTNIIIYLIRAKEGLKLNHYLNPIDNDIHISYVSVAEVESFALQNNWGRIKMQRLEFLMDEMQIIQVDDVLLKSFIDIDSYSQRNHPDFKSYPFETPRNMGKHDLWIAATASLLDLQLVTTDSDFNHLEKEFLHLRYIKQAEIRKYL